VLHLDEYKATGTKSWELVIRDEHGRLLFSIRLKQRDSWHIQAILRWFRLLGCRSSLLRRFLAGLSTRHQSRLPEAQIQYDFFHTIQNIHRHLYKALTAYRKAFKAQQPSQPKPRSEKPCTETVATSLPAVYQ